MIASTGVSSANTEDLPGHDITSALSAGGTVGVNVVRDAALYSYNMLLTVDGDFVGAFAAAQAPGAEPGPPHTRPRGRNRRRQHSADRFRDPLGDRPVRRVSGVGRLDRCSDPGSLQ